MLPSGCSLETVLNNIRMKNDEQKSESSYDFDVSLWLEIPESYSCSLLGVQKERHLFLVQIWATN